MSEISEIKEKISDLTVIMKEHISETRAYRIEKDKVLEAHSDALWDKNGRIGMTTRVDRIEQIESGRKWTLRAMITSIIAVITERIFHFLQK